MKDWWKPLIFWLALLIPTLFLITSENWTDVNWKSPGQFAWLLILPILITFLLWALWRRERLMGMFIESRLLPDLAARVGRRRIWVRMGLLLLGITAIIFALARPRWDVEKIKSTQSNLDILVAIDVSKSMLSADLAPCRLDRAKLAAKELKRQAPNERVGIMYFAGGAFLQCPLTSDEDAFRQEIERIWVKNMQFQEEGTSLAKVIHAANGAFVEDPSRQKVLVIFTDGEDHEGEAIEAARTTKADGMTIFTVGAGSAAGGVIAYKNCPNYRCPVINHVSRSTCDRCGTRLTDSKYLKDEGGTDVHSRLNEKMLKDIAKATGGFYLPLRSSTVMATLYKNGLAPMAQPDDTGAVNREIAREQYRWPLGAAMLLLLLEMFVPGHRRRSHKLGEATKAAMLTCLFFLCTPAQGASFFGLEKLFASKDPAEKQKIDPETPHAHRLFFNRGNEFYKEGERNFNLLNKLQTDLIETGSTNTANKLTTQQKNTLDKGRKNFRDAIDQYSQALEAEDLTVQQQAFFNIGNVHYRLGENEIDIKARIAKWVESAEHYNAAKKLKPNDPDAASNLAFVLKKLQQEIDKLPTLKRRMDVGAINRLQQQDGVALRIIPPTKEAMPERPYWRMLVFDGYNNGEGYTSDSLTQRETGPLRGGHQSWHGGRQIPEGMRLPGSDWRFQLEPLLSTHLPLPGPFESVAVYTSKPYQYNEEAFYGRLEKMPTKLLRYHVLSPADDQIITPGEADKLLASREKQEDGEYPWTTLELNITTDEKKKLSSMIREFTDNKPMNSGNFTVAAVQWLHERHEYVRTQIPKNDNGADPVIDWLKTEKPGHCEYFAYGFQLLARAAGYPTRVICGFAGQEYSKQEGIHVSRLSMAHAWAEIFDGYRWIRVEATPPEPGQGEDEGEEGDSPQEGENGQPQLSNNPQQPQNGEPQKLTPNEARELLEAARDQEQPLSEALEKMERMGGLDRWTNDRLERGRKRKNW